MKLKFLSQVRYHLLFIFLFLLAVYGYIYLKPITNSLPINSDGLGYYAYLPAVLIDHNLHVTNPLTYDPEHDVLDYPAFNKLPGTNYYLNKYPPGEAVMLIPVFLVAVVLSMLFHQPIDGYNLIFQHSVGLTAVFYTVLGFYFLYKSLSVYFSKTVSILTLYIILLTTSIVTYATYSPTFSHIYSFLTVSIFINFTIRWHKKQNIKTALILGLVWGLSFITRNTHVFLILFFILFDITNIKGLKAKYHLIKKHLKQLIPIGLGFIIVASIQVLYHYSLSSKIYLQAYIHEGFNWFDPAWYGVLFSPRRGVFFWAPALLISTISIVRILKLKSWMIASAVMIIIHTYLIASWYQWWFGDSYGHRAFIDLYPFFALFIAQGLSILGKYKIAIFLTSIFLVLCIAANTILMTKWWTGKLYRDNTFRHDVIKALQIWRE